MYAEYIYIYIRMYMSVDMYGVVSSSSVRTYVCMYVRVCMEIP